MVPLATSPGSELYKEGNGPGHCIHTQTVLQFELMPIPVSLADTNGELRSGNKSVLADLLTDGMEIACPNMIALNGSSCLVIDGQALVLALGRPAGLVTFQELGDAFVNIVLKLGRPFERIDVTFDHYREHSIKGGTRKCRAKNTRPIRKLVSDGSLPLPNSWPDFLALDENKEDLANFLAQHLLQAPGSIRRV